MFGFMVMVMVRVNTTQNLQVEHRDSKCDFLKKSKYCFYIG